MDTKKRAFEKARDLFAKNTLIATEDDPDYDPDYEALRSELYKTLKDTRTLDVDYLDHIPQTNGMGYKMLALLDEENAPLQDCYTALTFVLRVKDLRGYKELKGLNDSWKTCVDLGAISNALSRVCRLLK